MLFLSTMNKYVEIDIWLFLAVCGLIIFSLFNIFGIDSKLFPNHLIFFIIAIVAAFIFFKLGIKFFRLNALIFYLGFIFLVILTFLFGEEIRGSKRWINLFFFNFQSSEFLKLFFIIYLADFFSAFHKKNLQTKLINFGLFLLPIFLIFKQPDLGNAVVYSSTFLAILFFAGIPIKYFVTLTAMTLVSSPLIWRYLRNYQKQRIISFMDPFVDPSGISYNLIQSIITVGSGGFLGRGLGRGTQSRFLFLPENHTDFVFASLAEQFGFLGAAAVILLYSIIIFRLFRKAMDLRNDKFNFLFLIGVIFILVTEIFVNIGMNLGILPLTGIALPLMSYGGSSVVSTLMLLALAASL